MSTETRRFMRLLVFFDLAVVTKAERRAYTIFRRFLINDGNSIVREIARYGNTIVEFGLDAGE